MITHFVILLSHAFFFLFAKLRARGYAHRRDSVVCVARVCVKSVRRDVIVCIYPYKGTRNAERIAS